jgi:hypothetical protein
MDIFSKVLKQNSTIILVINVQRIKRWPNNKVMNTSNLTRQQSPISNHEKKNAPTLNNKEKTRPLKQNWGEVWTITTIFMHSRRLKNIMYGID